MSVIFFLALAALITGWAAVPSTVSFDVPSMMASEQALYDPATPWHNRVTVKATPSLAVSYKFKTTPPVLMNNVTGVSYSVSCNVGTYSWSYYSTMLLPGSYASLYVSVSGGSYISGMTLMALKGRGNYNRFVNGGWYDDVAIAYGVPSSISFYVSEADDYYFVVSNPTYYSATLQWNFALNKTFYDVSGATETCAHQSVCHFGVSNDDVVLVEIPGSFTGSEVVVKVSEEANSGLWWGIFGGVFGFLAFVLLVSALVACCRKKRAAVGRLEESRPLMNEAVPPPPLGAPPVYPYPPPPPPPMYAPPQAAYAPAVPYPMPPAYAPPPGAGYAQPPQEPLPSAPSAPQQ